MKRVHKLQARRIPVLPVGDVVLFPGCVIFVVLNKLGFRQKTVDKAMASDRMLLVVSDHANTGADPQTKHIAHFGTIGRIAEIETLPDGSSRVRVDGTQRGKVLRLTRKEGVFEARVQPIDQRRGKLGRVAAKALNYAMDLFFGKYTDYCDATGHGSGDMLRCVADPEGNHELWCDIIAGNLGPPIARAKRQELLETLSPLKRIRLLSKILKERIEEFLRDPELRKKVQAQRQLEREQAREAERQREAEMASKLEKLKQDIVAMLLLPPSGPRATTPRVAELPIMPIRDMVVLPFTQTQFVVGRAMSLAALDQALAADNRIFLATQHDANVEVPKPKKIYRTGTIAHILQTLNLPDNNMKVLVQGAQTGKAMKIDQSQGYFRGPIETQSELKELSPETITVLEDTWELVRHHFLPTGDQLRLLESFHKDGPLECIRQAIDMITAALKRKS